MPSGLVEPPSWEILKKCWDVVLGNLMQVSLLGSVAVEKGSVRWPRQC